MKTDTCPYCGSKEIYSVYKDSTVQVLHGPKIDYILEEIGCTSCKGEKWVGNEFSLEGAIDESTRLSISPMLNKLYNYGMSHIYIERVFGLLGSFKKWEEGEYTDEAVALLQILVEHPELVAEFDQPEKYAKFT